MVLKKRLGLFYLNGFTTSPFDSCFGSCGESVGVNSHLAGDVAFGEDLDQLFLSHKTCCLEGVEVDCVESLGFCQGFDVGEVDGLVGYTLE